MENQSRYRLNEAQVVDIQIMLNKSYRTSQRIMAKIKAHYGLKPRQRPTMDQVKSYFVCT